MHSARGQADTGQTPAASSCHSLQSRSTRPASRVLELTAAPGRGSEPRDAQTAPCGWDSRRTVLLAKELAPSEKARPESAGSQRESAA